MTDTSVDLTLPLALSVDRRDVLLDLAPRHDAEHGADFGARRRAVVWLRRMVVSLVFGWAPVLLDRAHGRLTETARSQAAVSDGEAEEVLVEHDRLDGWIDYAYRALKNDRDGRALERRLDAAVSVEEAERRGDDWGRRIRRSGSPHWPKPNGTPPGEGRSRKRLRAGKRGG